MDKNNFWNEAAKCGAVIGLILAVSSVLENFSRMGGASSSMEGMLSQIVNELQNSPAPSMLKTIWGGVWSCLLFGVVFGLIIAGVIARAPKNFGKDSNE